MPKKNTSGSKDRAGGAGAGAGKGKGGAKAINRASKQQAATGKGSKAPPRPTKLGGRGQ
jgi:hypothetical protein